MRKRFSNALSLVSCLFVATVLSSLSTAAFADETEDKWFKSPFGTDDTIGALNNLSTMALFKGFIM